MIGYFGPIIFETSDKKILNFSNLVHNAEGRFGYHEVINNKPKSEFEGPALETIEFNVNLNGNNGIKPADEIERWLEIVRNGEAHPLVIRGRVIGEDLWSCVSISNAWNVVMKAGELFSANITVSLEEYISEL